MTNQLRNSFFWSALEQGGASIVGFVMQIMFARLLAPEIFGVMAILLVFISLMNTIAQSGLGLALVQRSNVTDDSYSTAFWLSIGLALVMYLVLFFSAAFIAGFYRMEELALYMRVLGISVFFNSFVSIQRSYLQRSMNFKSLFAANILSLMVSGAIGIGLAFLGYGIWALIGQNIAQGFCASVALTFFLPWRPKFVFLRNEARGLFQFGWKICATGLLGTLHDGVSELILGKTCNATDLGFYSQGRKYPNMVSGIMVNALSNVLFPVFSKLQDDLVRFRASMKTVLSVGTFIAAPVSLLCCVIADALVIIFLGEKWLPAVFIARLTFVANSFLMFDLVNLRAYVALGKSGLYMKINVAKMVVSGTAICITAIVTKNIYSTAIVASAATIFGVFFFDMFPARAVHGYTALRQIEDQLPTYIACIVSTGCACCCFALSSDSIAIMIPQIIIFVIVYILSSLMLNKKTVRMFMDALGIRRK